MTFAHTGASYARGSSRAYRNHVSSSDCRDSIPAPIGRWSYYREKYDLIKSFACDSCVTEWPWACCDSLCWRRARFKRSNSVTASVQADLDPEGFPGLSIAVPTQDKSLQFGCSFQRHSSEPESASQYTECHRTVHTQGQWAYREVGLKWCAFRAFCLS